MAVINFAKREISCKIVYFGAADAGCNTNVRNLHSRLDDRTGPLHRFLAPSRNEATWYFEHLDSDTEFRGFHLRFRVFSLPGGIRDADHRNEVLNEVDGVVFIADARQGASPDNESALLELEDALKARDLQLAGFPVVLQVNHCDAGQATEIARVARPLNAYGFPVHRGSAKQGEGVLETFESILTAVRSGLADAFEGHRRSMNLRAHRDPDNVLGTLMGAMPAPTAPPVTPASLERTDYSSPREEIELPYLPATMEGRQPVRVLDATLDQGQVVVELELERMGGGDPQGLRVKLANRAHNRPPSSPQPLPEVSVASPISGITDHLPDKIDFTTPIEEPGGNEVAGVVFGIIGVIGGIAVGLLIGFLLFN